MSFIEKIKSDLLSVSAVVVTILHVFMIVGGVTCWAVINTKVLNSGAMNLFGN